MILNGSQQKSYSCTPIFPYKFSNVVFQMQIWPIWRFSDDLVTNLTSLNGILRHTIAKSNCWLFNPPWFTFISISIFNICCDWCKRRTAQGFEHKKFADFSQLCDTNTQASESLNGKSGCIKFSSSVQIISTNCCRYIGEGDHLCSQNYQIHQRRRLDFQSTDHHAATTTKCTMCLCSQLINK